MNLENKLIKKIYTTHLIRGMERHLSKLMEIQENINVEVLLDQELRLFSKGYYNFGEVQIDELECKVIFCDKEWIFTIKTEYGNLYRKIDIYTNYVRVENEFNSIKAKNFKSENAMLFENYITYIDMFIYNRIMEKLESILESDKRI